MDVINNNPYRLAGILSNASTKDTHKQKAKIKAYTKVEKELIFPVDYSFLQSVNRTSENTNDAFSKIEQNKDKVIYSLFWFIDASPYDKAALGHLENGSYDKAIDIWSKVTDNKSITASNFSALHNLGTVKLLSDNSDEIKEGIDAKFKLLSSNYINSFVALVADETYLVDKEILKQQFSDVIINHFKSRLSTKKIIKLFSNSDSNTKQYLSKKFTETPIHNIEVKIESSKKKRKDYPKNAYSIGESLYNETKSDIKILKSLLGISDLQYKLLADNLAKELLQCGVDYFQYWEDTRDPSDDAIQLFNYANKIAVGKQTKDRIQENLAGVTEWKSTQLIKDDIEYVAEQLNSFGNKRMEVASARSLVNNCKPRLQKIKNQLGARDSVYLQISSAVVGNALGMIVMLLNDYQEKIRYNQTLLLAFPGVVDSSVKVINSMSSMDMEYETRQRYQENKTGIASLNRQLEQVRHQLSRASNSSSNSGGGCYIATMAYGDYNHPQVKELRIFRDETLRKSKLGNLFIKYYYKYSPSLVKRLKNHKTINRVIRNILDLFIKTIK